MRRVLRKQFDTLPGDVIAVADADDAETATHTVSEGIMGVVTVFVTDSVPFLIPESL